VRRRGPRAPRRLLPARDSPPLPSLQALVAGPLPLTTPSVYCASPRSYGAASSVCSIILATEASLGVGLAWTVAICCLGCPWACIWASIQLFKHGSLQLAGGATPRPEGAPRGAAATAALLFLPLYAVFFQVFFGITWAAQPLVPFKTDDMSWLLWWLMTTCFDYYGCCLVYVAIICATEETPLRGLLWSLGALLVGTPSSCAWIVMRLMKYDTLCLDAVAGGKAAPPAEGGYLRSS
jgi:hypothetical protein